MAIYVITGKPRHGKTYLLIRNSVQWIKSGERIFSNVWLNLDAPVFKKYLAANKLSSKHKAKNSIFGDLDDPADLKNPKRQIFYWRNMRDWGKMENGTIIADEGTRYFNPRRWTMLSEETEIKLQQHGKQDLDIWLTTQHFSRIDATLRVIAESFFIVRKRSFLGIAYCTSTEHYLEDMERVERANEEDREAYEVSKEKFLLSKKFAQCFDTNQLVGKSEGMELLHDERLCKICGKTVVSHR